VGGVTHVRFFVFQAVHNAFKLLIYIGRERYILTFGFLAYLEKGWTGVLLLMIINFRIGIKIAFFSLFFKLSQQTVRTAYILASDGHLTAQYLCNINSLYQFQRKIDLIALTT
jgi:hypothetical protein